MSEIKSAREIAMEKVERLDRATDEERLRWQYVPEGEKLAATYLRQNYNLLVELGKYDEKARKYVAEGAGEVLIRSISLPKDDLAKRRNRKAMDGLKILKSDKVSVENVYSKIRRIFNHYTDQGEQQKRQAYEKLKAEFEAKVQQAVQQQVGLFSGIKINVEQQPQFQIEWRKLQAQLDSQYLKLLDEFKLELPAIP